MFWYCHVLIFQAHAVNETDLTMRGKWFEIWIHRSCYLHPITAGEWGRLMIGNVEECADRIVIHHQLQIFRKHFMSTHLSCLLPLCPSGEFAFYGWAEFADESYWRAVWTRISKPYISLYVGCFHFGLHVMYMKYMCTWVCTHMPAFVTHGNFDEWQSVTPT